MVSDNYNIWHNLTLFATHPKTALRRLANLYDVEEQYRTIHEVFIEQIYHELLSVLKHGTILIDIGANIGDTAIYFAMSPNVRQVYAYEPMPKTYDLLKKNVSASPVRDKMRIFNKGIAQSGGGSST